MTVVKCYCDVYGKNVSLHSELEDVILDTKAGAKCRYAETRGQAKALLLHSDEFDGFDYIEIPVYRASLFDECYRGEWQMDWYNAEDRIALCKAGWSCIDDAFDPEDCKLCPANKYCDRWEDYQEEMRDDI